MGGKYDLAELSLRYSNVSHYQLGAVERSLCAKSDLLVHNATKQLRRHADDEVSV